MSEYRSCSGIKFYERNYIRMAFMKYKPGDEYSSKCLQYISGKSDGGS